MKRFTTERKRRGAHENALSSWPRARLAAGSPWLELKQLEFFLLRYVPNAVKEEFVNAGVLLRHDGQMAGSAP